ncbi:FlgO family outer membrane protein [Algibacter sp. 2305UL17-15]|uniref:FlgO family outer membrane protein n=1 Tax=Algibacter sp. 2305UL17-15 TaxID=3231268 RepID=UPI00345A79B4
MKHLSTLFISCCILNITALFAQDFDSKFEKLAQDLSHKIDTKGKKKIAVWGFVTEGGERTALGNYLTEDFSIYMTNFADNFEIIDRKHLDIILKEHKLNSEGYIDKATAKELQKIIAVDAIVTGTYTVLSSTIKVRAKALDTETALQFAANMTSLPMNEDVNSYLGIAVNGGNNPNKGFNTPLNSNETINNPETVDSKCKKMSTGDVCFSNSLNEKIVVKLTFFTTPDTKYFNHSKKTIILDAKETKCVYGLVDRPLKYHIAKWKDYIDDEKFKGNEHYLSHDHYWKYLKDMGELKVETCKSKTYTIK